MDIKEVLRIIGLTGLTAGNFMFIWIFLQAYRSSSKTLLVDINRIGEANLELGIIILLIPCSLYFIWWYLNLKDE